MSIVITPPSIPVSEALVVTYLPSFHKTYTDYGVRLTILPPGFRTGIIERFLEGETLHRIQPTRDTPLAGVFAALDSHSPIKTCSLSIFFVTPQRKAPRNLAISLLFQRLSQRVDVALLTVLCFYETGHHDRSFATDTTNDLTYDTLKPLLELPSLQDLTIDTRRSVRLTSKELVQFIRSWPGLRALQINSYAGWGVTKPEHLPSLSVVIRILRRWPSMERIALDVYGVVAADVNLPLDCRVNNLRHVEVRLVGSGSVHQDIINRTQDILKVLAPRAWVTRRDCLVAMATKRIKEIQVSEAMTKIRIILLKGRNGRTVDRHIQGLEIRTTFQEPAERAGGRQVCREQGAPAGGGIETKLP
ncbi:hypothetical protein CONPUDRAFT_142146 [Coniophora puteana RWD-64-598 SS2]|uniref:F-box domain-containing protein n=1 Tax=Coniophora puteana (strain RWD-64-598) TaxID=741705 RepID=A0A5M3N314_CONPW|nr:uncharacterized protein CONPUDRAFT_142146 [Coniophora puteana RWD-64-598 SS2]EIW85677.1 hypothetical protein CONPUDRAFT_142146 [Coniophora puteana RWD-64-598 SS2]